MVLTVKSPMLAEAEATEVDDSLPIEVYMSIV
jgi:hypothetical protein